MEDELLNMELYNSVQSFFIHFYYEKYFYYMEKRNKVTLLFYQIKYQDNRKYSLHTTQRVLF